MPEQDINVSDPSDIRQFVLAELAKIQVSSVQEIEQRIVDQGGDLEIDSEEGVGISHGLESRLQRDFVEANDLHPKNFTSIERLTAYLYEALQRPARKKPSQ